MPSFFGLGRGGLSRRLRPLFSGHLQNPKIEDQGDQDQQSGDPGQSLVGVQEGGPVLDLHQMSLIEDLKEKGEDTRPQTEKQGPGVIGLFMVSQILKSFQGESPGGQAQEETAQIE